MKKSLLLMIASALLLSSCAMYVDPFPKVVVGGCSHKHAKKGHC